jgi:hypothetical protein
MTTTHTDAWVELAESLGAQQFVERHPGHFLLSSEQAVEPSRVYTTATVDFGAKPVRLPGRRNFEVRWIAKAEDSPYPDRISVGRARNCDISFRHPSVSKLHAHFRVHGNQLTVTDLGSRNGTRINNGIAIAAHQPQPLTSHDRVQFGSVQTMVLDVRELFDLLSRIG